MRCPRCRLKVKRISICCIISRIVDCDGNRTIVALALSCRLLVRTGSRTRFDAVHQRIHSMHQSYSIAVVSMVSHVSNMHMSCTRRHTIGQLIGASEAHAQVRKLSNRPCHRPYFLVNLYNAEMLERKKTGSAAYKYRKSATVRFGWFEKVIFEWQSRTMSVKCVERSRE